MHLLLLHCTPGHRHVHVPLECMYMTFIIHEMLRRQGNTTQQKDKATQLTQGSFSKKKAASGGTQTHDHSLSRRRSYQLSYRGYWRRVVVYAVCSNVDIIMYSRWCLDELSEAKCVHVERDMYTCVVCSVWSRKIINIRGAKPDKSFY